MTLTPGLRKLALAAHVTVSVGWLGAVAGFLVLAVAGLASPDAQRAGAAYLAMELIGWFVIVPLSFASPLTGLVQSLGTAWGLFRHYWVLVKFLITIPCTVVLLLHMQPTSRLADAAASATLSVADLGGLRIQLVADAVAAVLVLLVATTLAVYKPQGMTRYGARRQHAGSGTAAGFRGEAATGMPRWVRVSGFIVLGLALVFVMLHLTGNSFGGHRPFAD